VAPPAAWVRLDSIVLTWIVGTISIDLHSLLRNLPHAWAVWLAIEGQFLGNTEARALRLDAAFCTFVQGDLSVSEYCRKMKTMADSLGDLGCPVEDRNLVLNVLRGLSDRYTHLWSLIMRQRPIPTFLQVRDDLALEDITLGAQATLISGPGSSSSSTALAALPPTRPPTPSGHRSPGPNMGGGGHGGGGGGGGGRRRRGGRGGGGHAGPGGGARGSAPTPGPQQGAPWPTFHHPWSGRISMWPFQGPVSEARPPVAMFAAAQPGFTSSPGFAAASPSPWTPSPTASSWPTPPSTPPSGLIGWDATALAAFQTPTLTPPLGPEWIADTGATYHTTPDPGILTSVRPPPSSLPSSIMVANGSCLPVTSMGAAGPPGSFRMPDVLIAPSLVHNLLFIRRFTTSNSCSVEFDSSGLIVKDSATQRPLLRCDSTGPLYTIRLPHATSSSPPDTAVVFAATMSSTTWHRRLGHPGHDALMQLTRSATIPCTRSPAEHVCHACQLGRHVRLPFSSSSSHATHAFDLVHCDLWTSPITSMSGYKYYLVVLDDFSHYVWTFPLRAKSETFPTLRHFFAWVSTQFGLTIKAVQCDNGCEFDNSASRDFFLSHGMQLRMSCPYTSSQNGKAERMIRTTNDTIRTLLLQAHLPARFWAEALHTSTYLLNCLPSTVCPAPLLTRHSSVPLRAMTTSVSSGVLATRTPLPLLLTSLHPVPPSVCFSGTPQTTRAIAALTSPLAGSSSLAMWCLMSPHFPTPPRPDHLPVC
jgi:transposase InsO family protein/uncharacterized membrane protein YgcG